MSIRVQRLTDRKSTLVQGLADEVISSEMSTWGQRLTDEVKITEMGTKGAKASLQNKHH